VNQPRQSTTILQRLQNAMSLNGVRLVKTVISDAVCSSWHITRLRATEFENQDFRLFWERLSRQREQESEG
jgi:hypothetical protein